MDYCGRALECATLDGWAVYRNRSPQHNVREAWGRGGQGGLGGRHRRAS